MLEETKMERHRDRRSPGKTIETGIETTQVEGKWTKGRFTGQIDHTLHGMPLTAEMHACLCIQ